MGYHVEKLQHDALRFKPEGVKAVWIDPAELLAQQPALRLKWLQDERGLAKSLARSVIDTVAKCKNQVTALSALETLLGKKVIRAAKGRLVIQPGKERARTSSHYTPRSLSGPIVERTLEPFFNQSYG